MARRTRTATLLAALAPVPAGCSAGGGDSGGGNGGTSLTVWTIEDVADRATATAAEAGDGLLTRCSIVLVI
jgi:hypothetical protein